MSKDISKVKSKLLEVIKEDKVGDIYFYNHGSGFYRIYKIEPTQYSNGRDVAFFQHTLDGIHWDIDKHNDHQEIRDMGSYTKLHLENGETPEQAISSLKTELVKYITSDGNDEEDDEEEDVSEETGLMPVGGKTVYENAAATLMRAQARAEIVAKLAEKKMQQIRNVAYGLQKKLNKVMKILMILEVYLGVHEEIFQIMSGAPAPAEEPISIRQLVLYMDEEAAIVKLYHSNFGYTIAGDINWKNVEEFDNWVSVPENLNVVLPEKKGLVALRASRQDRYGDLDPMSKAQNENNDKMIYLLIRNGDNLYRVYTSIKMGHTLFPTREQSESIEKLFASSTSWDQEKGEDEQQIWIRNALLIQGLLDRTPVFYPLPERRIELAKPETFEPGGPVRMIRDGEMLLSDGSLGYKEWMEQLNSHIQRGTRIYTPGVKWESEKDRGHRFIVYHAWGYPPSPDPGVYTVEEVVPSSYGSSYTSFRIMYLPSGDAWSWQDGYKERTNRFSFKLSRSEVINYDEFQVEDIDRILKNRLDRVHYRTMMPTLIGLREARIKELEDEMGFIRLLSEKYNIEESLLINLVDWWKKKVINKRPLGEDSDKAWRMIISKARRHKESKD